MKNITEKRLQEIYSMLDEASGNLYEAFEYINKLDLERKEKAEIDDKVTSEDFFNFNSLMKRIDPSLIVMAKNELEVIMEKRGYKLPE